LPSEPGKITRAPTGERPFLSAGDIEETINSLLQQSSRQQRRALAGRDPILARQADAIPTDQLRLTL
jgi:DNA polymerase-4